CTAFTYLTPPTGSKANLRPDFRRYVTQLFLCGFDAFLVELLLLGVTDHDAMLYALSAVCRCPPHFGHSSIISMISPGISSSFDSSQSQRVQYLNMGSRSYISLVSCYRL